MVPVTEGGQHDHGEGAVNTSGASSVLVGLLRSMRPRQWAKNVLVIAAPLAAGSLFEVDVLAGTAVAFVAFCLTASAVYLLNDVRDVDEDRRHPTKRHRPIAAGTVPPQTALGLSALLFVVGIGIGFVWATPLGATLLVYAAAQVGYALWLKNQPVLDLAIVASGFLLRAVAGGTASDIPLSQWFLLVASFGSLFMVAGKRYSEIQTLGSGSRTRRTLEEYSESYLRFVWGLAAGITIVSYSLWAFEVREGPHLPWEAFSIAPFVLALLRYAADVDRGLAGAPEDIVLKDWVLQLLGGAWLVLVALGVFR
ncbi:MAG: decaprenyl-phosphate phosphoribosyltransferase [Nocardioidaceae bacterium]